MAKIQIIIIDILDASPFSERDIKFQTILQN